MNKKKVAFICVHNSCRSQIAEALGKHLASDVFESYSAGTAPAAQIQPDAVRILLTRVAAEGGLPAGLTADPDAHDVWFRAKVQEALADPRPAKPHDQVMREARSLIDGKRRA